ncbi:MAG: nucleotidyltransferase family protein [Pseudomonadota bacterium]|nr:nucleotidyltransferase family protein [Pseudomonadota bacterium]
MTGSPTNTGPVILLLAAGSSSRMRGGDKLLEDVNGQPCLRVMALRALATGQPVMIALPPDRPLRDQAIHDLPVTRITVPNAADGMGVSLATAAAHVTGPLMVVPADMPALTQADFEAMLAAHKADPVAILRGTDHMKTAGHPVVFPLDLINSLRTLTGDTGAKDVIKKHKDRLRLIPLPDNHATLDLDTPESWQDYRARGV